MKLGITLITFSSLLLIALLLLPLTGVVSPWEMPSPIAATGRFIIGGLIALWCIRNGIMRIRIAKANLAQLQQIMEPVDEIERKKLEEDRKILGIYYICPYCGASYDKEWAEIYNAKRRCCTGISIKEQEELWQHRLNIDIPLKTKTCT